MVTTQKNESLHVRECKIVRGQATGRGSFRAEPFIMQIHTHILHEDIISDDKDDKND